MGSTPSTLGACFSSLTSWIDRVIDAPEKAKFAYRCWIPGRRGRIRSEVRQPQIVEKQRPGLRLGALVKRYRNLPGTSGLRRPDLHQDIVAACGDGLRNQGKGYVRLEKWGRGAA